MGLREFVGEAWQNLMLHRLRSGLAALGIIFGVASVICMVSISEVARRDVVSRIERMGLTNVILDSVKPERVRKREKASDDESWIARYGIKRTDLDVLRSNIGVIEAIVPMRIMLDNLEANLTVSDTTVVSTTHEYAQVMQHAVEQGRFLTPADEAAAAAVCVLGSDAARTLFPLASPLDQVVQIGANHFKVVGVLARKGQTGSSGLLSDPDAAAYIPYTTSFARFGKMQIRQASGSSEYTELEVNRAVVKVADAAFLEPVARAARHLMETRHKQKDVTVTVPFELMVEHQQAERIFLWVMGSLAAISLLVGGIGIMNIMLANMAERRHEIGLRRALGANRRDIVSLFVGESALLSLVGGVIGMGVGAALAVSIGSLAQWSVAFQAWSFPLALGVAVLTGLSFGTLPALKAARMDPVLALRAE
jgi:putative ABC transport system permease protein